MKNIDTDDKLKRMLQQLTIEQPADDFTDKLMQRLHKAKSPEPVDIKPKQWVIIISAILLSFIGIVIVIFHFAGIDLKSIFSFEIKLPAIDFSSFSKIFNDLTTALGQAGYAIYTGVIAIVLLTIDMLIRRRLHKKEQLQ